MNLVDALENRKIGGSDEALNLASSEDSRLAIRRLAEQAVHSLCIMTRDLDSRVYDDPHIVSAIKDFALASRRTKVRIIVRDITRVVNRGHRLVELHRRLPSHIGIRIPAKEHLDYNSAFVLADSVAVLFRSYADRYEGLVNFNDPQTSEELSHLFGEMWESATPPADLRRIVI